MQRAAAKKAAAAPPPAVEEPKPSTSTLEQTEAEQDAPFPVASTSRLPAVRRPCASSAHRSGQELTLVNSG